MVTTRREPPIPVGEFMADETDMYEEEKQVVEKIHESRGRIERELSKVIVGQKEVIEQILIACSRAGTA